MDKNLKNEMAVLEDSIIGLALLSATERHRVIRYLIDRFSVNEPNPLDYTLNTKSASRTKQKRKGDKPSMIQHKKQKSQDEPSDDDLFEAIINENHNLFKRLAQ